MYFYKTYNIGLLYFTNNHYELNIHQLSILAFEELLEIITLCEYKISMIFSDIFM